MDVMYYVICYVCITDISDVSKSNYFGCWYILISDLLLVLEINVVLLIKTGTSTVISAVFTHLVCHTQCMLAVYNVEIVYNKFVCHMQVSLDLRQGYIPRGSATN